MTELNTSTIESQRDRWLKYGLNVGLSVVIVLVLAIVLLLIAGRTDHRFDTTAGAEYSLKPQTLNIVHDLKEPITIVSLYTHPEPTPRDPDHPQPQTDYAGIVNDLLDEYAHAGSNITVDKIDPLTDPAKVTALVRDVTDKYGGEVKKYKQFVDDAPQAFKPLKAFAANELPLLAKLPIDPMKDDDLDQTFSTINDTVAGLPARLDKTLKDADALTAQKLPDYKGAADAVQAETQRVSDLVTQIEQTFAKLKADPKLPVVYAEYIDGSIGRYDALKKLADGDDDEYKKLGTLKLDDIRTKLKEKDAILVMGPHDMRSLSFDQVWKPDTDRKAYAGSTDAVVKPKFSGEQQITGAILSLTMATKPKVVFIRPGGEPLTTPGFPPFQQGGPMSLIAERLRDYNLDVQEKDLSGQYAAQAQMQGMPAPPEPTDDEIKDAVWIIVSMPTPQNPQQPTPPPPSFAPKLAEHLKAGKSALCLYLPKSDTLSDALKDYGIDVRTDLVAVHEPIMTETQSGDLLQEIRKQPVVFVTNRFGTSPITSSVNGLQSVLVPVSPVLTTATPGCQVTPILPLSNDPPSWGEHDFEAIQSGNRLHFDAAGGDIAPPLFGGAMSENHTTHGRVVAIGSLQFAFDQILKIPDTEMAKRNISVSLFPANAELFCNSVFWLAHLEPLIAISPSAMEVSRIRDMSDATLRAWRVGLLLIGLPGAVVLLGLGVYLVRRD